MNQSEFDEWYNKSYAKLDRYKVQSKSKIYIDALKNKETISYDVANEKFNSDTIDLTIKANNLP